MHCSSSFEIGLFGTSYFAGLLVASFIFPPLGDIYGRKIFVVIACWVQALGFLMFLISSNYIIYLLVMLSLGISCTMKIIGYSYMMELLPGRESFYSGILFFIEGVMLIVTPVILVYITRNLQYFLFFCFLVNFISCIVFLAFRLPESVRFTLEKN